MNAHACFSANYGLLNFLRSTHNDVSHPGGMPNLELTEHEIDQISA